MAMTTSELKLLKEILSSLEVKHKESIQLCCDGQTALYVAKNFSFP